MLRLDDLLEQTGQRTSRVELRCALVRARQDAQVKVGGPFRIRESLGRDRGGLTQKFDRHPRLARPIGGRDQELDEAFVGPELGGALDELLAMRATFPLEGYELPETSQRVRAAAELRVTGPQQALQPPRPFGPGADKRHLAF